MKPGRNDRCPCGSGRKYKHCCGAAALAPAQSSEEFTWRRLRRLLTEHTPEIRRFTMNAYGPEGLHEAWSEFDLPARDEPFDPHSPHLGIFFSWFFHFWVPARNDTEVKDSGLHGIEPTRAFLARRGARLDPLLREYLDSCLDAPMSFHEVVGVEGEVLHSREFITGAEQEITERLASETLQPGDIVFGQVVRAGNVGMLECCSTFAFPPIAKIEIAELRRGLLRGRKRASFRLRDWDYEMRLAYLEMARKILEPGMPQLSNTDGEPMSPRKIVFDIDSPQGAFDALKHLDPEGEEDAPSTATHDTQGQLSSASLTWIKAGKGARGLGNTVLANIRIEGRRLVIDVNSEAREERIRKIVTEALGDAARYRATEIQSIERMLREARANLAGKPEAPELPDSPEVKSIIDEHMRRHYESWVTERIPALGNRTPLQAVRSRAGREAVEALVRQIERDGQVRRPPLDPGIARSLRERLGLTED